MPEYRSFIDNGGIVSEFDGKVRGELPSFSDSCVALVSNEIRREYLLRLRGELKEQALSVAENVDILLDGTVNLANRIIRESVDGKKVDVLLFMDQSARNGAFLLRTLWSELERKGEIPDNVALPEFRFIDIGKGDERKYNSEAALTLLKLRYSTSFKDKKVVLIDEFIDSGSSIKSGMGLMKSVFGVDVPEGWQQFKSVPPWYREGDKLGIKGVSNSRSGLLISDNKTYVEKMDKANAIEITEMYNVVSKMSESEFNIKFKRDPSLSGVREIMMRLGLGENNVGLVWEYLKTAGGFVSEPLVNENRKESNKIYRGVLKSMVVRAVKHREEKMVA